MVLALVNIPQSNANPVAPHQALQAPARATGGVNGEGGSGGVAKECKPLMTPQQCTSACQTSAGFSFAQKTPFDMPKCLADCNSKCK